MDRIRGLMMEQSAEKQSIRDSRRRAAIAMAIVEEQTGPMKKLLGLTRKHPWPALAIAVLAGMVAGTILRSR